MAALIIVNSLIPPPSDSLALRYITMVSKTNLGLDVLIEVLQEEKDAYYSYMQRRGLLDYVEQFLCPPENERGIRIDNEHNFLFTIIADHISFDNQLWVLGNIKNLAAVL